LPALKRSITLFEASAYGVGVIVGGGIYALIGSASGIAGNAVWLSFVFAAITAMFTALSYAELSSMMPKAAAEYVYTKNAFRSKKVAFLIGWTTLYAGILTISTVAVGFAGYARTFIGLPGFVISIFLVAALSLLSFWGIKESAKLNIGFTLIEVLGLIAIIAVAIPFFGSVNYLEVPGNLQGFGMLAPISSAAALIFFAYLGFEDVANLSEETKNARRNIPKALLLALAISTILYIAVSLAVVSVVPWQELSKSNAPMELVAQRATGGQVIGVLAIIAMIATMSTLLVSLVAFSRRVYGMAKQGILPSHFARVHGITGTPYVAIASAAIISILFVFVGGISQIAALTNLGLFVIFFAVNASLIALRFREPDARREFRVPFSVAGIPVTGVLGCILSVFMLFQISGAMDIAGFNVPIIFVGGAIILASLPVYFVFYSGRNRRN